MEQGDPFGADLPISFSDTHQKAHHVFVETGVGGVQVHTTHEEMRMDPMNGRFEIERGRTGMDHDIESLEDRRSLGYHVHHMDTLHRVNGFDAGHLGKQRDVKGRKGVS